MDIDKYLNLTTVLNILFLIFLLAFFIYVVFIQNSSVSIYTNTPYLLPSESNCSCNN